MGFLAADLALARHSYYDTTVSRDPPSPPLEGSASCDVAVVGGGFAGLCAAIELADRGHDVVLLEARRVGWAASGRNGGQVIAGLACDQSEVERLVGEDDARRIWAMTLEAIETIHQHRARFGIDCDWQGGYLSVATSERKARELGRWEERMAARYGHRTTWIGRHDLQRWLTSPRFHAGVHDARSGHLNPLKYALGLARAASGLGIRIHEHSAVTAITPGARVRVGTALGEVHASRVLLAGNVYVQSLAPVLAARIMPVGTYMVASAPLDAALAESLIPSHAAVSDTNLVLDYFRIAPDHRLLFGGRISYSTATPWRLKSSMQRRIAATFPQLGHVALEFAWGGFVDVTMNRAPDFGRLADSKHRDGPGSAIYYVQGFSGHGLALTGLAGRLVAEAIDGDASRFDVFARIPHRRFPGGPWLRMPALVAGMAYYRLKDLL